MLNKRFALTLFAASSFMLSACAHQKAAEEVDKKISQEPAREFHGGVAYKGFNEIQDSKALSGEQKQKLMALHIRMAKEIFKIQEETSKLKAVLFETITTAPYDGDQVEVIKKRLISLNDKKMRGMLGALNEVKKILGVPKPEYRDVYRAILNDRPGTAQF